MIGTTLSHYRIVDELGRGGMGIVYKATDTKLNRAVALKVLPAAALASEDDRARFFREAQSAAQLHHPNIATIFQIDEAIPVNEAGEEVGATDGARPFIAMELVEGETLQEHVKKGPLKLQEAISIGGQIAEALKAAHEKKIVHRDIKSANVMLTPGGVAKVLDFGLAKTNQSTMLTRMGSTLGTVAFMSPEQARGQEVDGRSDLYSLGTVIYEMVAGRLPFEGEYEQAVLYSILNETPESLTALRAGVPMQLDWLVNKLLSKEAEYRYQTAADLLADLKSLDLSGSGTTRRSMPAVSTTEMIAAPAQSNTPKWMWPAIIGALILGVFGTWMFKPQSEPIKRVPAFVNFDLGDFQVIRFPSVSNDGRFIAFRGASINEQTNGIVQLDVSTGNLRVIPNTSSLQSSRYSPDNRWLFMTGQVVSKVPTTGGTPVEIASAGFWPVFVDNESVILDNDRNGAYVISIEGEVNGDVFVPDSLNGISDVEVNTSFGDGRRVLLSVEEGANVHVAIGYVDDGTYKIILRNANDARYVRSGHLVFIQGNESFGPLMARPFDLEREAFTGAAVPVIEGEISWLFYDVAPSGTFVRMSGNSSATARHFYWYSLDGEQVGTVPVEPGDYSNPAISPDGTSIAFIAGNRAQSQDDIWVMNAESGNPYRLTFAGEADEPAWSADGNDVLYNGERAGSDVYLFKKPGNGSGVESVAARTAEYSSDIQMSADGKWWVFDKGNPSEVVIQAVGDSTNVRIIDRPGVQSDPTVSPNGLYVAYETNENGPWEIFVQELHGEAFWAVSAPDDANPTEARWSPNGDYLYYRNRGALHRVKVRYEPTFGRVGLPEVVFDLNTSFDYALHPDGERILVLTGEAASENSNDHLEAILNFDVYLEQIAPPDKK